jgi:3-methyladenine DNA glycosylase AlkC
MLMPTHNLAQATADAIAHDRPANFSRCDDASTHRRGAFIIQQRERKQIASHEATALTDLSEFRLARQALSLPKLQ